MTKKIKIFVIVALISIVPTLLLWLPFFWHLDSFWGIPLPKDGMATVVSNYDGPLYIVVSKTLYNTDQIVKNFSFPLPAEYYAAHFPLYPMLIRIFAPIFGYLYSMLIVTVISSVVATYYFYIFIKEFVGNKNALLVTAVFSIFPARWLISHSVGSADPLFVATILASIYHFRKEEYWKAGAWGALAQFTKSAAVLLFIAYAAYLVTHKMKTIVDKSFGHWIGTLEIRKTLPLILMPLSLLAIFVFYGQVYGDYLAYFRSGDNIHLFFPPFQIFNFTQTWVGTYWLEEIIFVYLFGAIGVIKLVKKNEPVLAWFTGIFFASLLFVSHRDLIRYGLPIVPFLYAAFSDTLSKKEFQYAFLLLIIPIYLFALVFISQNVMPISDWAPFVL